MPRPRVLRLSAALLTMTLGVLTLAACADRPRPAASETPSQAAPAAVPALRSGAAPSATASETPRDRATASATPTAGTSAAAPAGRPGASPSPSPTPAAPAFTARADPSAVGRGETLLVRVQGISVGTIRAGTRSIPLIPVPGGAWAVVGIGLGAPLGPASLAIAGRDAQGAPAGEVTVAYAVTTVDRPIDELEVTEEIASILTPEAIAREAQLRAQQFSAFDAMPRWAGRFVHPLAAFEVTTIFGSGRSVNGGPVTDMHSGEDLAVDEGTPVMAAAPGRIAWTGMMPIRGNSVIVDHGGGVLTGYHHLLDIGVTAGQQVTAGALLGHAGSTGFSTGPHLHWELTIYGENVDPETWTRESFPR